MWKADAVAGSSVHKSEHFLDLSWSWNPFPELYVWGGTIPFEVLIHYVGIQPLEVDHWYAPPIFLRDQKYWTDKLPFHWRDHLNHPFLQHGCNFLLYFPFLWLIVRYMKGVCLSGVGFAGRGSLHQWLFVKCTDPVSVTSNWFEKTGVALSMAGTCLELMCPTLVFLEQVGCLLGLPVMMSPKSLFQSGVCLFYSGALFLTLNLTDLPFGYPL